MLNGKLPRARGSYLLKIGSGRQNNGNNDKLCTTKKNKIRENPETNLFEVRAGVIPFKGIYDNSRYTALRRLLCQDGTLV